MDAYPAWQRMQQARFLTHRDTHVPRHVLPRKESPDHQSVVTKL
jgi:hypothetical protein